MTAPKPGIPAARRAAGIPAARSVQTVVAGCQGDFPALNLNMQGLQPLITLRYGHRTRIYRQGIVRMKGVVAGSDLKIAPVYGHRGIGMHRIIRGINVETAL